MESLFEAITFGKLELVRKEISNVNIIDNDLSDYKLLTLSLEHKQKEITKFLLNKGCRVQDLSKKDFLGTPLYYAIKMQDVDIVKLLLSKGLLLHKIDQTSESLFELLLEKYNKEIITLILTKFVEENVHSEDSEGFSPIHIACYIGHVKLVEQILNCNTNSINLCICNTAKSFPGYSPLHFAVESECLELIEMLVNHSVDITVKDATGKSVFYLACEKDLEQIRNLLMVSNFVRNPHSVDDEGFSLLYNYLFYKHIVHFNISYQFMVDTNWTSWTPLHFAVAQQKTEIVKLLLKENVNVNAQDDFGITPLHLACQCTYIAYARIVHNDTDAETKYWNLNQHEQSKIAELLLEHHANVNATDKFGKTPLFHALENFVKISPIRFSEKIKLDLIEKRKRLINLLVQHGADVKISDKEGVTILHDLAENDLVFGEKEKIGIARLVLSKGADASARTKSSKTPLLLAIRNRFIDLAQVLISHGADINCVNASNGFTPLHNLTYYSEYSEKSVGLLNTLLAKGADVHAVENVEATPLHVAIDCHGMEKDIADDMDEMALILLRHGSSVDAQDMNGQTALHRACLNRYTKGAVVLLNHGADINIEDKFDNTPLSCACYRVQEENNINFLNVVRSHVNKLRLAGLYVSGKNESSLRELERFYGHRFAIPRLDRFLHLCELEVERLKKTSIDGYTTLYHLLFKNSTSMTSHVKNAALVDIMNSADFDDMFQAYGYLLKLQFEKGLKRKELMQPAEETLKLISKQDLPELCVNVIFKYLSDYNLQKLIEVRCAAASRESDSSATV